MELNFIEDCSEEQVNHVIRVSFVTVAAFRNGKYVLVKRRNSTTLELPEIEKKKNENPRDTVRRLLKDELGVKSSRLDFVTAYSRTDDSNVEYGLLYYADIDEVGIFPYSELASVYYLDHPPKERDKWSDPDIQIALLKKAEEARTV